MRPRGVEPRASGIANRCSVQLSYGRIARECGSPDRDRTCCLLGRNQVLSPDELRSQERDLGWPGRDRTGRLPACQLGALPSYTTRQWRRERDSDPCAGAPAPTYLGSNQAPSARLGYLSREQERGGRASRTLMPARRRLPFSRRWPLPMGDPSMNCAMRVGPDGIEPPTSSMWTRRSAAELWTNDRGTGDAVPRRRCALDHQALRTG